ncbi:MAG: ParB/RepB/Spo0J family partition protein [Chloroflexota bacterium]|nr:ParB/RepB/Spo0J family partition protein [Chloroflexota bacterium]
MSKSSAPLPNALVHFLDQAPGRELEHARQLPIDQIDINPLQSRQQFDEAGLDELRRSIEQYGILEPLLVRPAGDRFLLVAGERRYRAAIGADLSYVPVIIMPDLDEAEAAFVTATENLQREDLDIEDEARQFAHLLEVSALSQRKLAETLGVGFNYLSERVRLLKRPDLIARYRQGDLTWRQAIHALGSTSSEPTTPDAPALYSRNTGPDSEQLLGNTTSLYSANTDPASILVNGTPMVADGAPLPRTPRAALDHAGGPAFRPLERFEQFIERLQPAQVPPDQRTALIARLDATITAAQAARRALEQAGR